MAYLPLRGDRGAEARSAVQCFIDKVKGRRNRAREAVTCDMASVPALADSGTNCVPKTINPLTSTLSIRSSLVYQQQALTGAANVQTRWGCSGTQIVSEGAGYGDPLQEIRWGPTFSWGSRREARCYFETQRCTGASQLVSSWCSSVCWAIKPFTWDRAIRSGFARARAVRGRRR